MIYLFRAYRAAIIEKNFDHDVFLSIKSTIKHAYSHHIERLMIQVNLMNLCEIKPRDAYKWFMELYIDSSDWVMTPNVYSMGLFADGGIMATKPYICGSNYILKMMNFKKGPN